MMALIFEKRLSALLKCSEEVWFGKTHSGFKAWLYRHFMGMNGRLSSDVLMIEGTIIEIREAILDVSRSLDSRSLGRLARVLHGSTEDVMLGIGHAIKAFGMTRVHSLFSRLIEMTPVLKRNSGQATLISSGDEEVIGEMTDKMEMAVLDYSGMEIKTMHVTGLTAHAFWNFSGEVKR
jgi:hypothetical protein